VLLNELELHFCSFAKYTNGLFYHIALFYDVAELFAQAPNLFGFHRVDAFSTT
jgi:hypothetical protein